MRVNVVCNAIEATPRGGSVTIVHTLHDSEASGVSMPGVGSAT